MWPSPATALIFSRIRPLAHWLQTARATDIVTGSAASTPHYGQRNRTPFTFRQCALNPNIPSRFRTILTGDTGTSDNSLIIEYHPQRSQLGRFGHFDWGKDFRADRLHQPGRLYLSGATIEHTWWWSSDSFFSRIRFAADYDRTEDQSELLLEKNRILSEHEQATAVIASMVCLAAANLLERAVLRRTIQQPQPRFSPAQSPARHKHSGRRRGGFCQHRLGHSRRVGQRFAISSAVISSLTLSTPFKF